MNQTISQSPFDSITATQTPYNQPSTIPYPSPTFWQPPKPSTIEDRLTNIEKELKEIKETLEWIKWRI